MRNRFRQKTTSLLLSALVLLLGMVPPGVGHAHAGGDDSTHEHDKCREAAHHGLHDHDSDGHDSDGHDSHSHHSSHHPNDKQHEPATGSDRLQLADSVLHLHWQLFGIDFSMPISEKPTDGADDEENVPSVVVRVREEVVPAATGPAFGRMLQAATSTLNLLDVVWTQKPVSRPSNLVTTIPLCDSARLERSGVLLS